MKTHLLLLLSFIAITCNAQNVSLDWVKTYGGTATETGKIIRNDSEGNLFIIGNFMGTVDFDPGPAVHYNCGLFSGRSRDPPGFWSQILMYAVIATGGKQYRVSEGTVVRVEKLDAEAGTSVEFDKVLVVGEEEHEPVDAGAGDALRRLRL